MKFVVGLGNPGEWYAQTRHNVGWQVLGELDRMWRLGGWHERWGGLAASKGEATLFRPLTHMNESGRAVAALVGETGTALTDLLVVLDDMNLSLGALRMRPRGSAGGHRGLQSVIEWLGTDELPRLRLGIGPGRPEMTGKDFVLSPFDEQELPLVTQMVERATLAVQSWASEGVEAAMNRYNAPVEPEPGSA